MPAKEVEPLLTLPTESREWAEIANQGSIELLTRAYVEAVRLGRLHGGQITRAERLNRYIVDKLRRRNGGEMIE